MGAGDLNNAVTDAGPLIHLHEIGSLSLLGIFNILHIPEAVWHETVGLDRVPEGALLGLGSVRRHTPVPEDVAQFVQDNGLESLHSDERECLYLCRQATVSTLLTDDLAVREASKRLGIIPVGSLGVVARSFRLGHLSLAEAEQRLWDLHHVSTLFVTPVLVELVMQQLRGHEGNS